MKQLGTFLKAEKEKGKIIYPRNENIFKALKLTPFEKTKVVIIGEAPFKNLAVANGLAYSTDLPKRPTVLGAIFKEVLADMFPDAYHYRINPFKTNDLTFWAKQGVLLLNSILTTEKSKANAHKGKGWETFTLKLIEELSKKDAPIVFMFWGDHANHMKSLITNKKHLVLEAPYPTEDGFFGCKHFSECNRWLNSHSVLIPTLSNKYHEEIESGICWMNYESKND